MFHYMIVVVCIVDSFLYGLNNPVMLLFSVEEIASVVSWLYREEKELYVDGP